MMMNGHNAWLALSLVRRRSVCMAATTTTTTTTTTLVQQRRLISSHSNSSNPLELFQRECTARRFCDDHGDRLPNVHWTFSIGIAPTDVKSQPPNLRTVGIERVTSSGMDFAMKRSSPAAWALERGHPMAMLHTHGKYLPGERAEQWRAEGHCQVLPLTEILDLIPSFTIASMVTSVRLAKQKENGDETEASDSAVVSQDRSLIHSKSHFTEVLQTTRHELDAGKLTMEEMEEAIRCFRFIPDRMECMYGGPEDIGWERYEWQRDSTTTSSSESTELVWKEANPLLAH